MDCSLVGQSHLVFFLHLWADYALQLLPKYLSSFGSRVSSLAGFVLTNPQTYRRTKQLRMAKWAKTCPIFLSGWPNKLWGHKAVAAYAIDNLSWWVRIGWLTWSRRNEIYSFLRSRYFFIFFAFFNCTNSNVIKCSWCTKLKFLLFMKIYLW